MLGVPAAARMHYGPGQQWTASANPSAGRHVAGGQSVVAERCLRRVSKALGGCRAPVARLVQLGIRQSRYCGRGKTKFQLYLVATVANLTLVLGKIGQSGSTGGAAHHRVVLNAVINAIRAVVANAAANFSAVRCQRPGRRAARPGKTHALRALGYRLVESGDSVLFAPAYRLA